MGQIGKTVRKNGPPLIILYFKMNIFLTAWPERDFANNMLHAIDLASVAFKIHLGPFSQNQKYSLA